MEIIPLAGDHAILEMSCRLVLAILFSTTETFLFLLLALQGINRAVQFLNLEPRHHVSTEVDLTIGERLIRRFHTVTRFSSRLFAPPRSPPNVLFRTPVSRCKSLYREYFTRGRS